MVKGKSVRIYLPDGSISGLRHGEIVNWTGQAIACPRARFTELKEWNESKRPGVYFLFGKNEETSQDEVYIGQAEKVLNRLHDHISGKEFWTELVAFTNKDDNLTKSHVGYLESRLIALGYEAGRHNILNSTRPPLPTLPRADIDAMEEFIGGIRTLLGVLGHRVLEPYIVKKIEKALPNKLPENSKLYESETTYQHHFQLRVSNITARAARTEEGVVVLAGSEAAVAIQSSLSMGYVSLRDSLIKSGVLISDGAKLIFSKDQLFSSPSQAAAVIVGYAINGRDVWRTSNGTTFSEYEVKLTENL